jgi:uncharacterized protein (DUF433 family)
MTLANPAFEFWVKRLNLPAYQVAEAARYAGTTTTTIANWQKKVVSRREARQALSYLQLIEVGVVAAMRASGVKLDAIRDARDYLAGRFNSDCPFAEYRFKTNGKALFVSSDQLASGGDKEKLVVVSQGGQLAWNQILSQLLREFEYDKHLGKVSAWKVAGTNNPIRIDPRIAFGAPQVKGTPTWVLRERWESGESVFDIADDYSLAPGLVKAALRFEGVEVEPNRPNRWVN